MVYPLEPIPVDPEILIALIAAGVLLAIVWFAGRPLLRLEVSKADPNELLR